MNRTLRCCFLFFFFNDTATTEIYTLSLHDALPISGFGITYLSGVAFTLEERIVFGAVLGAMTVALTTFVPALLIRDRSEEHTSELQSQSNLVCRLLLEKKKR